MQATAVKMPADLVSGLRAPGAAGMIVPIPHPIQVAMSLFRAAAIIALAGFTAGPAQAQNLRDLVQEGLFKFGDCPDPLCLNSGVAPGQHGKHYIGGAEGNATTLLDFLSGAIAVGVSNVPISTATSGITFSIVGGIPVQTSSSTGPIIGERVQTLGQGRFLIGVNVTGVQFASVRGVPLNNLTFNFTHENVCRPSGQPAPINGPCPGVAVDSALGSPALENDVIEVSTSINLKLQVASLYMSYGLFDRVDVGVAIPLVRADLTGGSIARIVPFVFPTPHFFGSPTDPVYQAGASVNGTATGIGDVAARIKANLGRSDRGVAVLAEARFPTGDENQFLGSGHFALRALAIASTRWGSFTPHVNAGYFYRNSKQLNDAVLTTVGFDQLLAPWATMAVDVVGQWQAGRSSLSVPDRAVTFSLPVTRKVSPTNLPNRPDNILDGSVGFKFLTRGGITIVTNAVIPLNDGGMRGRVVLTGGAEYNF